MELSYSQIVSECFRNFRKSPKDAELWEIIAEYEHNFLAVTYEADGSWWVQFITSARLLPRHKTKKDLRTPAPPTDLIEASEKRYLEWKRAKGFGYQRFQKSSANYGKFPIGVGVGVGVGVGIGEGEKQQTLAQLSLAPPTAASRPVRNPVEAIYQAYPRKVGKGEAVKAIRRAISNMQAAGRSERAAQEYLFVRTAAYARSPAGRNGEFTPHPATWFNRGSFDDDEQEWQRPGDANAMNGRKNFGELKFAKPEVLAH